MNLEEKGKIYAMGIELQNEINNLEKRKDELVNVVRRVIQLQKPKITDEFGDELPESEIQTKVQRAFDEFKKCMPETDIEKTSSNMES